MADKTVFSTTIGGFDIAVAQNSKHSKLFTVVYGKQVSSCLNYSEAGSELGSCILHALSWEGVLDSDDDPHI